MSNIVSVKLIDNGKLPVYSSDLAAGCDFHALESDVVKADEIIGLKRVIAFELAVDFNGEGFTLDLDYISFSKFSKSFDLDTFLSFAGNIPVPKGSVIFRELIDYLIKTDTFNVSKGGCLWEPSKVTRLTLQHCGEQLVECQFNDPEAFKLTVKKHPIIVRTGVLMAIPEGLELELRGRSGLGFKHELAPHNGTIDADYRGEIMIKIYNHGNNDYHFEAGERICQGVIKQIIQAQFEIVDELPETVRGDSGFGGSGKK
jgi:dUTP pyrophosphatase